MTTPLKIIVTFFIYVITTSCSSENTIKPLETKPPSTNSSLQLETRAETINYLALGDSYTIGESVCETCRFPEQLKKSLKNLNEQNNFSLEVIAQTGWTTLSLCRRWSANETENHRTVAVRWRESPEDCSVPPQALPCPQP